MLVITADSHITTIAGLVGKKIGINAPNSLGILLISALLPGPPWRCRTN